MNIYRRWMASLAQADNGFKDGLAGNPVNKLLTSQYLSGRKLVNIYLEHYARGNEQRIKLEDKKRIKLKKKEAKKALKKRKEEERLLKAKAKPV